jgi:hypothetical protein
MPTTPALDERWRLLLPPGTIVVAAQRSRHHAAGEALDALAPGVRVAVVGDRRCLRLARRHGVKAEKSYVVLPSLARPVAVALVAKEPLRWFTRSVLTLPPGTTRLHGLKWAAVKLLRSRPKLVVRAPVGDRIVIGVRE